MSIAIELTRTPTAPWTPWERGVFAEQLDGEEAPTGAPGTGVPRGAGHRRRLPGGQGFKAKPGESCVVPGAGGGVVVAWARPRGDATVATYRKAAAALARATTRQAHLAIDLLDHVPEHLDRPDVAQALTEGVVLGAYRYTALKSDPEPHHVESLTVVGKGGKRVQTALERGRAVAEAVCLARDLVNQPGGTLTPTAFATQAEELGALRHFEVEVLDRAAIEDEGLGGLLGVNRGRRGAAVRQAVVEPDRASPGTVALVGKGITFDSGGLSLKTADDDRA